MDKPLGVMPFVITLTEIEPYPICGYLAYIDGDQYFYESFSGAEDLLFKVDAICDEQGHPQRDTLLRTINKTENLKTRFVSIMEPYSEKKYLVFEFTICMRRHSSIQGYICSGENKVFFRSSMECMKLLRELNATKRA